MSTTSGARELTDSEIAYLFADDPEGYLDAEERRILAGMEAAAAREDATWTTYNIPD